MSLDTEKYKQDVIVRDQLFKLVRLNSWVSPGAFERGVSLIAELGNSYREISRASDGPVSNVAMAAWDQRFAEVFAELTRTAASFAETGAALANA